MNNLTLLMLQGIPGSGKSTWARNFIKNNSDKWVIINRDSIRDMLGNYWIPKREDLVTDIETASIKRSLHRGFNVIIDATNLNEKTLKIFQFIKQDVESDSDNEINITIEYRKFEIALKTAIWRDWWRGLKGGRKVGKKVITYFYNKYYGEKE